MDIDEYLIAVFEAYDLVDTDEQRTRIDYSAVSVCIQTGFEIMLEDYDTG